MAIELFRPRRGLTRRGTTAPTLMENMLERMFSDPFWRMPEFAEMTRSFMPPVDMTEKDNEVVLRADLPGMSQKDIEVNVEDGMLTIKGERHSEETEEKGGEDYYCCERWAGRFERSLSIPHGIDDSKVEAKFKDGVLEVHLPKTKETRGKRIEIK